MRKVPELPVAKLAVALRDERGELANDIRSDIFGVQRLELVLQNRHSRVVQVEEFRIRPREIHVPVHFGHIDRPVRNPHERHGLSARVFGGRLSVLSSRLKCLRQQALHFARLPAVVGHVLQVLVQHLQRVVRRQLREADFIEKDERDFADRVAHLLLRVQKDSLDAVVGALDGALVVDQADGPEVPEAGQSAVRPALVLQTEHVLDDVDRNRLGGARLAADEQRSVRVNANEQRQQVLAQRAVRCDVARDFTHFLSEPHEQHFLVSLEAVHGDYADARVVLETNAVTVQLLDQHHLQLLLVL